MGFTAVKAKTESSGISSLDALETTVPLRMVGTRAQRELHKEFWKDRVHILDALLSAHDAALNKRAVRIDDCCSFPSVAVKSDGKPALILHRCKDRMCPRCQKQRSLTLSARIAELVKGMNAPRMVTLTLKHRNASLSQEHKRLADGFKALRKSKFWKANVKGGVYGIETPRNVQTQKWHCHMHLIVDGSFMSQKTLSAEWKIATGDSDIVDIRMVNDREKTAKYLAKYILKPNAVTEWDFLAVREFATALKGKRLVHTFGTLHGKNVDPAKDPAEATVDAPLCSLHRLTNWAERGHAAAQRAIEVLCSFGNAWRTACGLLPMQPNHAWIIASPEEITLAVETCREVGNSEQFPMPPEDESPDITSRSPENTGSLFGEGPPESTSAHEFGL